MSDKSQRFNEIIKGYESVVIGFSGGVDSTLVAKVSFDTLGEENVWLVTGKSESMMPEELEYCKDMADWLHIPKDHFVVIETNELSDPNYSSNPTNRCYFCKQELFGKLKELSSKLGAKCIVDGSNASDLADYRPGSKAGEELEVKTPLAEAGFSKDDIRELAKKLGLPNWDKPSMPCLASRIPYNSEVTSAKLNQIAEAERLLRKLGFTQFRVRHHDKIARLEVDEINLMLENGMKDKINEGLKKIGFTYVTVDLGGFKSGSLNINIEGNKQNG